MAWYEVTYLNGSDYDDMARECGIDTEDGIVLTAETLEEAVEYMSQWDYGDNEGEPLCGPPTGDDVGGYRIEVSPEYACAVLYVEVTE